MTSAIALSASKHSAGPYDVRHSDKQWFGPILCPY